MAVSDGLKDHLLELLAPLGDVTFRRMFGGGGLFIDGQMFGLVADERLFLKTDDHNRAEFEGRGLPPFVYETQNGKRAVMAYHEAPPDALEDGDSLWPWAQSAAEAARRAAKGRVAKGAAAPKARRPAAGKTPPPDFRALGLSDPRTSPGASRGRPRRPRGNRP